MHDHNHDHSTPTHSASCDSCEYTAQVHAHDDDEAVQRLAQDLSDHNLAEHKTETVVEEILDSVRQKMERLQ